MARPRVGRPPAATSNHDPEVVPPVVDATPAVDVASLVARIASLESANETLRERLADLESAIPSGPPVAAHTDTRPDPVEYRATKLTRLRDQLVSEKDAGKIRRLERKIRLISRKTD